AAFPQAPDLSFSLCSDSSVGADVAQALHLLALLRLPLLVPETQSEDEVVDCCRGHHQPHERRPPEVVGHHTVPPREEHDEERHPQQLTIQHPLHGILLSGTIPHFRDTLYIMNLYPSRAKYVW
ncbi:MAG TPA: hypothetical protein VJC20_03195, partial [Candidatus Paceibacterota bacterium]